MVLVVLATGEGITVNWLLAVPAFVCRSCSTSARRCFLARVADKFRDTVNLLPFFFRLVFYGSGVIYAVDTRFFEVFERNPWVVQAFVANPFYAQLSLWREALMTSQEIQLVDWMWVSASLWALAC
jgi:teichoic acid transport system permease protein